MPLRNRFILPAVLSSLAILVACGGGSSNPPVNPPPSGGFSNSNLNGTYVFSVTGTANTATNDFVAIMGVFTADGKGNITNNGLLDQNSTAPTGLITLQTGNSGSFQFAYALTSSTHGLVTQFESFGSASGTLDLQASVT